MSIDNSLIKSLNEAIEYEKGTIALRSNSICVAETEDFSPSDIRNIRKSTGLSQSTFAAAMGVTKKAVEAWECGRNIPSGTARRMLEFVENDARFFEKMNVVEIEDVHETSNLVVHLKTESSDTVKLTANGLFERPYRFVEVMV